MKRNLATVIVLVGALLGWGCATKKYVRQTTEPIGTKVDQVAEQSNKQGQTLDQTVKRVDQGEVKLSATDEKATAADSRASDALNRANTAGQKADQNGRDISELRQTLGNLDDYKVAAQAAVPFGFNKDTLTPQAKEELDKIVSDTSGLKRYFVAVEGFTDRAGPIDYNLELSRRRANRVVEYLVAKHDIPVYRIQMVGLGKDKPADEGRGRAAAKKNRRVEVTVYSADTTVAGTPKTTPTNPQQK